jgi:hypothetical protein
MKVSVFIIRAGKWGIKVVHADGSAVLAGTEERYLPAYDSAAKIAKSFGVDVSNA